VPLAFGGLEDEHRGALAVLRLCGSDTGRRTHRSTAQGVPGWRRSTCALEDASAAEEISDGPRPRRRPEAL